MVLTLSCSCASVNLLILPLHLTLRNIDVNIQPDFNSRESYRQLSGEDQAIMVWLRTGAIRLWCHTLTKSCARESSMCHCGLSPVMVEHFLQDCQTHQKLRAEPWPADTHQQTKFLLSASGGSPVREKKYSLVKNLKHIEQHMSELPEFLSEWTAKKKKHVFMSSIFRSFQCLTTPFWNLNTLSTSNISDSQHNQNSWNNCLQRQLTSFGFSLGFLGHDQREKHDLFTQNAFHESDTSGVISKHLLEWINDNVFRISHQSKGNIVIHCRLHWVLLKFCC